MNSTLVDAESHGAAQGTFKEIKKPKRYSGYADYLSKLIEEEPSTFEEVVNHQEWKYSMNEEYQSIMKNEVWEMIPRTRDKFLVTFKWIYKIKHATYGSIDKNKERFLAKGFSQ